MILRHIQQQNSQNDLKRPT